MTVPRPLTTDDRWEAGRPPLGGGRFLVALVWLVFILVPVVTAVTNSGAEPVHLLAIVAAVLFTAAYVWLVLIWIELRGTWRPYALAAAMLVLAIVLTLVDRPGWGFLFSYVAACVGLVMPSSIGMVAVIGCAAVAAGCSLIDGGVGRDGHRLGVERRRRGAAAGAGQRPAGSQPGAQGGARRAGATPR